MNTPSLSRLIFGGLLAAFTALATFAAPATLDDQPVEKSTTAQRKANSGIPTFWIVGDSTVKVGTAGQRGWGDELTPFFDAKKVNIVNRAIGGRSSRTFITDGRWDEILKELRSGDVVIVQFGHNDASPVNEAPPVTKSTRARGTIKGNGDETQDVVNILTNKPETVHSYGWYLRQIITTGKAKGATVIICSPIPRKSWSTEGKINRASGNYGLWAKQAAEQDKALFIDLNEIIARGYEKLGQPAVEPLFGDKGTHTSPLGAAFNARAVVAGINGLKPNPLAFGLSEAGKAVPPFTPEVAAAKP